MAMDPEQDERFRANRKKEVEKRSLFTAFPC
jgi:hypothetical protein